MLYYFTHEQALSGRGVYPEASFSKGTTPTRLILEQGSNHITVAAVYDRAKYVYRFYDDTP
jgi:hypothetical protein